jgi:hypothetical protein
MTYCPWRADTRVSGLCARLLKGAAGLIEGFNDNQEKNGTGRSNGDGGGIEAL